MGRHPGTPGLCEPAAAGRPPSSESAWRSTVSGSARAAGPRDEAGAVAAAVGLRAMCEPRRFGFALAGCAAAPRLPPRGRSSLVRVPVRRQPPAPDPASSAGADCPRGAGVAASSGGRSWSSRGRRKASPASAPGKTTTGPTRPRQRLLARGRQAPARRHGLPGALVRRLHQLADADAKACRSTSSGVGAHGIYLAAIIEDAGLPGALLGTRGWRTTARAPATSSARRAVRTAPWTSTSTPKPTRCDAPPPTATSSRPSPAAHWKVSAATSATRFPRARWSSTGRAACSPCRGGPGSWSCRIGCEPAPRLSAAARSPRGRNPPRPLARLPLFGGRGEPNLLIGVGAPPKVATTEQCVPEPRGQPQRPPRVRAGAVQGG